MIKKDLVFVGAGPAGMAAAISAYRNGVKDILIIERDDCLG
ncbi:MAG: FAD-dependent oxidoreductase, partial [Candidatus Omnitrophica bacterium]|nr:FAD-dependent oxidoreductase [Candidatus Omnitrophota bacterium]